MVLKDFILAFILSFCSSACCAFYMNTDIKHIPWGGLLGAVGWVLYKLVLFFGGSSGAGFVVGAFSVAMLSEILAVILRNPATVFLVPGLLPLVPGGGIFAMMRAVVQKQFELGFKLGYDTLVAAASIALGIAISSSLSKIFQLIMKKHIWRK